LFETRETNWSAPENRDLAGKIEDSRLVLSADRLQPKDLLAILGPKTRKTKAR
jgi:hypothetical protein